MQTYDEMLNKDPFLIAFKNGVYDFTQHLFRPGKPEDYLSNKMPIDYVDFGSMESPMVVQVLDFFRKMFPNNAIREYFLDQVCQVFVGGNFDKVVLFWTGVGNNGKTVTQTLFEKMLGRFAITFDTTVLTGNANPEMARAWSGVRWAVMEEPNPDEMINAGTLKWLTDLFKLHIICNELPPIKDVDQAVKNRARVIPFESTFVPENEAPISLNEQFAKKIFPMDKDFVRKIPDDMLKALAWFLIERYKRLSNDRPTPVEVTVATDEYMRDNDIYKTCDAVLSDEEENDDDQ